MAEPQHVLRSIKKLLGLDEGYRAFDVDIMIHINSAFSTLHQLGVGPEEGFAITGDDETWDLFLGKDHKTPLNSVKSYVYLKTRLLFDPPPHAFLLTALESQIEELEWRLTQQAEEVNQNGTQEG